MHPSHRERLLQVEQESGLDFVRTLDDPDPVVAPSTAPKLAQTKASNAISTAPALTLGLESIDPILSRHGELQPGDMIDFHGPSCSGKTLLLYAITIATILPKAWKYSKSKPAFPLLGKARSVLFIDMEQGFSADRLKSLLYLEIVSRLSSPKMRGNIAENGAADDQKIAQRRDQGTEYVLEDQQEAVDIHSPEMQAKIEQLALSCLKNVHIFRPSDAISTIVMLRTMDQYLAVHTSNASNILPVSSVTSPPAALLLIDSLSSFYWQERAQVSHTRFMTTLMDALNRLVPRWKLVFISTTWSLPSSNATTDRTVTDALRGRLRYRFLMQPRTLERLETEDDLLREWSRRQDRRRASDKSDGKCTGSGGEADDSSSLFQAQMIIPYVEVSRQELFRISVSNTEGIYSFSVPPAQQ